MIILPKRFRRRQAGYLVNTFADQALIGRLVSAGGGGIVLPSTDANLWGWWTSDTGISLTSGKVTGWSDRSGLSHDLTVTFSNTCTLESAVVNGKNAIKFLADGSHTELKNTATLNQPCAMFLLFKAYSPVVEGDFFFDGANSFGAATVGHAASQSYAYLHASAGTTNLAPRTGFTVDQWHVLTVIWNGSSTTVQIDNQTPIVADGGTNNAGGFCLGNHVSAQSPANQYVAACVIRTGVPDATQIAKHKNYLADYAGISLGSLPASSTPSDDPNLYSWQSADTGLSNNGSLIDVGTGVWLDRSGFGRHMDVATSQQPAYHAADVNGKASIGFSAGSAARVAHPTTFTGLQQPWAIFLLFEQLSWVSGSHYLFDGRNGGNTAVLQQSGSANQLAAYAGSASGSVDLALTTWGILMVIWDGSSSVLQINNLTPVTVNPSTATANALCLGNYGSSGGGSFSAETHMAAAIVTIGRPSSAIQTLHKNWLAAYGGITI